MKRIVRNLVARSLRATGFSLLRTTSEYRAFTDLFISPYSSEVDWQSGIDDAIFVLFGLARSRRPEVIVEIGSARGKSTCALALACRNNGTGHVYAIDPHTANNWSDMGTGGTTEAFLRERLRDYRLDDWCDVMAMTSLEAAKNWSQRIDLLFIDGDHTFDGVRADFEAFRPWLASNALVLFHDTTWNYYTEVKHLSPDMQQKLAAMGVPKYMEVLQRDGYQSVTLPVPPGLTIVDAQPGGFVFCPAKRREATSTV
jgi:predicted O-methyltransferase YrrM